MEETTDGFRIAEEDLAIRGPGEFMGVRQSGLPDFRVANIARDGLILNEAKTDAFALVEQDAFLNDRNISCCERSCCTAGKNAWTWQKRDNRRYNLIAKLPRCNGRKGEGGSYE